MNVLKYLKFKFKNIVYYLQLDRDGNSAAKPFINWSIGQLIGCKNKYHRYFDLSQFLLSCKLNKMTFEIHSDVLMVTPLNTGPVNLSFS